MANKNQSFFLEYLGDTPKLRVLDFLMDNFNQDFSLPQIAKGSNIAYTTLIDMWDKLVKQKIVIQTRKVGKSKLYKLDIENPIVKALFAIDIKLSDAIAENELISAS